MCKSGNCTCSLDHDQPDKFDRSQWCPPGRVSTTYAVYKVLLAAIFMGTIAGHITNSQLGAKWFIYMTDQGFLLLAIHFLLESILVACRWTWERSQQGDTGLSYHTKPINFVYKLSWVLNSCFFTIALWITLIYWSVLHKYVLENHLMKNTAAVVLNVFLHGVNSLACLVDIFVSARPWRPLHFGYAIGFGIYYTLFSVIYWASGGTGICRPLDPNVALELRKTDPGAYPDGIHCDKYIYPILDWEDNAGLAIGVILGGCLVIPLIHLFWMFLAQVRIWIYKMTRGRTGQPKSPMAEHVSRV